MQLTTRHTWHSTLWVFTGGMIIWAGVLLSLSVA